MRLFKRLKGLPANEKGNVLILTAAAMPLLVGSAGLAMDTIQLSLLKRHLQRAADSGALAGAYAKAQLKEVDPAVTKALTFNDAFPLSSATTTQPTTGTFAGRSVRVQLAGTRSLPFMSFFTSAPTINVSATAALVYSGKYCMVALDESAATGINFAGSSTVNLGCGIISNTSGAAAVQVDGNATSITASPVAAVGGVPSSTRYKEPTLLLPYSLKQDDPFKSIGDPAPPMPCLPQMNDSTVPEAGKCYKGIDINNAKTLPPGTYYLTGDLRLNANARITAHGVTFVLTSETPSVPTSFPKLEIDGSAQIDLTAPTSGPYEGIIMHYDGRGATMSPGPKIEGNSASTFEGAFYFPKQHVTFRGNSNMATNCIQMVALRLTFEGNTVINNECPTGGGAKAFDATWVRLVG